MDRKACVAPIDQLDCVKNGSVLTFQQVLDALVATGEINITVTHHTLVRDASSWTFSPKSELVFRLDPRASKDKPKPKKQAKAKGKAKAKAKAVAAP